MGAKATVEEFLVEVEKSFKFLQLDYIDLFSFHGLNKPSHFDDLFGDGGQYAAILPYVQSGKIRHVGFSTHAPTDLICKFIDTDKFEYVNLHYHYFGSYTASGHAFPDNGNKKAFQLAKEKGMGIFIISPFDKGGGLFNSSRTLRNICDTEGMDPMEFGVGWLLKEGAHTMTVGVGRVEDYDEPHHASVSFGRDESGFFGKVERLEAKLDSVQEEALGKEWVESWWDGLPSCFDTPGGVNFTLVVWVHNLFKSFGMRWFALERHSGGAANLKSWDPNKTNEENIETWSYVPGLNPVKGVNYEEELKTVRPSNFERVKKIVEEDFFDMIEKDEGDKDWEQGWDSIDLRPWVAYPER